MASQKMVQLYWFHHVKEGTEWNPLQQLRTRSRASQAFGVYLRFWIWSSAKGRPSYTYQTQGAESCHSIKHMKVQKRRCRMHSYSCHHTPMEEQKDEELVRRPWWEKGCDKAWSFTYKWRWADLQEAEVGRRETREEVRGDEAGQPLPRKEQKRRRLYLEAAELQRTRPCSSVAPSLQCELHRSLSPNLSLSLSLSLALSLALYICVCSQWDAVPDNRLVEGLRMGSWSKKKTTNSVSGFVSPFSLNWIGPACFFPIGTQYVAEVPTGTGNRTFPVSHCKSWSESRRMVGSNGAKMTDTTRTIATEIVRKNVKLC